MDLVFVDVQIVFKMEKSVATISIVQIYKVDENYTVSDQS